MMLDAETKPKRLGWHALRFTADARKVAVACAECQRAMYLPASKVAMYRRCSSECNAATRRSAVERRRRDCETCGTTFVPRGVQISNGGGRFCSQACNTAGRDALQAPEAKARAKQRVRELIAAGEIVKPRGPAHHSWKGGSDAQKARRRDSGKQAAGIRAYRKKNPHKVREFSTRRRGRKLARLPYGTIPTIGKAQRWKCAICRVGVSAGYHVDHIVPLARGGAHEGRNLQLLCGTCNVRKSAKDPITYMQELGRLL